MVKPHIFHFLPVFWDIFGIGWCLRSCQQWTTTSGNVSKESRTFKRVLSEYLQLTLRRLRDILLHQPTNDSLCSKVNGTRRFSQINVYFGNQFSSKIQMLSPIMGESTKIVGESKNSEIWCALPHYGGEQRRFSKIWNSDALPHYGGELGESTLPHFWVGGERSPPYRIRARTHLV